MTTLRRELRAKFTDVLNKHLEDAELVTGIDELCDALADAALELRGFQFKPQTTNDGDKSPLSETEIQQVNNKVDAIIANSAKADWRGRETFAPQDWALVDWYHNATGQDCPKTKYKDWHHAVTLWKSNGLTVSDLQAAYDMDIKWRGVFTSPNQLTDKAIALRAQGKVKTDEQPKARKFERLNRD